MGKGLFTGYSGVNPFGGPPGRGTGVEGAEIYDSAMQGIKHAFMFAR